MQYFKCLVALIATAFIGLGCGDPEVYLVKDGKSEFHLQWTEPLKEPRIVLVYVTEFNYYGHPSPHSYLHFFPTGEFRSRLFGHDDLAWQYGLLSVEIPPASTRDTLDLPHTVWDATTKDKRIDTALVGHPYKPYDVGKPSKLTFNSIDVQKVYLETEFDGSVASEGYDLDLVWKPGDLKIARYVLIRVTPLGQEPEDSLLFFPSGSTRLKLLHHPRPSSTKRGSAVEEWREAQARAPDPIGQWIRDRDKERIQKWLETRARVFRHDPEYCIVEILPADKLNKLKLPTTASYLGSNESVSVPVKHKFLPYE